jgi:hypothetical protein
MSPFSMAQWVVNRSPYLAIWATNMSQTSFVSSAAKCKLVHLLYQLQRNTAGLSKDYADQKVSSSRMRAAA